MLHAIFTGLAPSSKVFCPMSVQQYDESSVKVLKGLEPGDIEYLATLAGN